LFLHEADSYTIDASNRSALLSTHYSPDSVSDSRTDEPVVPKLYSQQSFHNGAANVTNAERSTIFESDERAIVDALSDTFISAVESSVL